MNISEFEKVHGKDGSTVQEDMLRHMIRNEFIKRLDKGKPLYNGYYYAWKRYWEYMKNGQEG